MIFWANLNNTVGLNTSLLTNWLQWSVTKGGTWSIPEARGSSFLGEFA